MLTNRDKQLLKFIENYGGISTQQATNIFFDGLRESATRRLNHLLSSDISTPLNFAYCRRFATATGCNE